MSLTDVALVAAWSLVPGVLLATAHGRLRAAGSSAVSGPSLVCGVIGLAVIAVALSPSVGAAAEDTFAGHMVQHLLLGLVGPLLIVVGRVPELVPWLLDVDRRRILRRTAGSLLRPQSVVAPTVAFVVVWYAWHVPGLYGLAVDVAAVHAVEHLSMLAVGVWYWTALAPQRRRGGPRVLSAFVVTLSLGFFGAVLSLSPVPFYADHVRAATEAAALDDQHLGGLLMWTPGGLVHLVAAVVQFVRWLGVDERPAAGARRPVAGSSP